MANSRVIRSTVYFQEAEEKIKCFSFRPPLLPTGNITFSLRTQQNTPILIGLWQMHEYTMFLLKVQQRISIIHFEIEVFKIEKDATFLIYVYKS